MTTTTTDPIADMLARIRNALAVNRAEVNLPHSNIKEEVAKLLKENNFIRGVEVDGDKVHKTLKLALDQNSTKHNITSIKRLSKPGQRQYVSSEQIPVVKRGRGIVIVSTSQGLMTGNQAQSKGVGGDLICEVY